MEPRLITRWEAARWAREAYDIGARCDALDSQTNALDSQTNALDSQTETDALDCQTDALDSQTDALDSQTALDLYHDKKTTQTGCWEVVVGSSHTI